MGKYISPIERKLKETGFFKSRYKRHGDICTLCKRRSKILYSNVSVPNIFEVHLKVWADSVDLHRSKYLCPHCFTYFGEKEIKIDNNIINRDYL